MKNTIQLLFLTIILSLFTFGCSGDSPSSSSTTSTEEQSPTVPSDSRLLYCISNIGRTLTLFDLVDQRVVPESQLILPADPSGPWFTNGRGYYLSRVAFDGSGQNALFEFDPTTLAERRRLIFPPNSNPSELLIINSSLGAVPLTGATFDDWGSNGIALLDMESLLQIDYFDLNDPSHFIAGERVTSVEQLMFNDSTNQIFALASNWYFDVRQGWLLVLALEDNQLVLSDTIALGINPQGDMVLDADNELWVVNNGGFAEFGGSNGTLQILDTNAFGDGIENNETIGILDFGGDPTDVFQFDASTAWVTTFPDEGIRTVNLTTNSLLPDDPALPLVTGPLMKTQRIDELYVGMGAFGTAQLGQVDPTTGVLLNSWDLEAGNGPVSCAEPPLN